MNREDLFYEELASCPVLPSEEFNVICKKIRRNTVRKNICVFGSITAVLLATVFGSVGLISPIQKNIHQEVEAELQYIQDFLDGEDINEQIEMYASYEGY